MRLSPLPLAASAGAFLLLAGPSLAAGPFEDPCAAPVSEWEFAVCEDPHLLGLDLQLLNLLHIWGDAPGGEPSEANQVEYAHHLIAREGCGADYRCLEEEITNYVGYLTEQVLAAGGRHLAPFADVEFSLHQSADSPGADLIAWDSPENFGWTEELCRLRCAAEPRCVAAGFDPLAEARGVHGYCTMKGAVNRPLSDWTAEGVLLIRE